MTPLKKYDCPICFQRIFVELTGTITGALFLSQAVYWQNRCESEDGWWWKTQQDWTEETGMTRHELVSAKEATKKFIRHKLGGVPCRSFWKVDADALDACVQLVESSSPESGELGSRKAANKSAEKRPTTKDSKTSTEKGEDTPLPPEAVFWNANCKGLPKVAAWSDKRQRFLSQRRKDKFWTDNYQGAILLATKSVFLTGGNDRGWKADFSWLIERPDSVLKIIEGKYTSKVSGANGTRMPIRLGGQNL